jgi:DNA-directed RNA polymerase subunit RPC12/RpoP
MNDLTTYCPRCGREISAKQFSERETCPFCGTSFILFHYRSLGLLCGLAILFAGVLYLFCQGPVEKNGALLIALCSISFFTGNIVSDQFLQRIHSMPRDRRKNISGWIAVFITILIAVLMRPYFL